jgi:hypothetical protein
MQDPTTCSQSYRFRTHPSLTPQVAYLVCGTTDRRRSNEPMPTPHQLQPADRSNCQHHAKAKFKLADSAVHPSPPLSSSPSVSQSLSLSLAHAFYLYLNNHHMPSGTAHLPAMRARAGRTPGWMQDRRGCPDHTPTRSHLHKTQKRNLFLLNVWAAA